MQSVARCVGGRVTNATELNAPALDVQRQPPTHQETLSEFERDLLDALTDEAVCTSVLHARSRLRKGMTPTTTRDRDRVFAACEELARRGLAERLDARSTIWWRRPMQISLASK